MAGCHCLFLRGGPNGWVGSFLLVKLGKSPAYFGCKHHYILHALDSEVLCDLLLAMDENRRVKLAIRSPRRREREKEHTVFPVKIYISTQTGRQYLLCYHDLNRKPMFFCLDSIHSVTAGAVEKDPERYSGWYEKFRDNLWGVSYGMEHSIKHIKMTIHAS